ncbi:MAG: type II toxin-antitoxin system MqsR family toxin [Bacteroidales bacterium]|nr:type II toxin-antitoxin system MqsR family toxin [Bacteroidales bacterium]
MVTEEQVKAFLEQFNIKAQVFGIFFRDDRNKNREALLQLDITPMQRELIVKNLQAQDYIEGPVIDTLNTAGEMWVFGKDVKEREVYIKITLGYENGQTICISFHIAEHPMHYPFKTIEK